MMSLDPAHYFSPGFQNFLYTIAPPFGSSEVVFPTGCPEVRASAMESAYEWFQRVVKDGLHGDVARCAIESNMGIIARIRYLDGLIVYANVQVVVAMSDLRTLYRDAKTQHWYFRLDYDRGNLGRLFREALPHIHSLPKGEPRFGCSTSSGNMIVDFFDFIYRNFYPDAWADWARQAYLESGLGGIDAEAIFSAIEESYKVNAYEHLLSSYSKQLRDIKAAGKTLKDRIFSPRIDIASSELLSYSSV